MYCDLLWLVFKSGFQSRAGYSGAHTVYDDNLVFDFCEKDKKIEGPRLIDFFSAQLRQFLEIEN